MQVCVQVMSVCVCGQSPSALRSSTFQGCLGEASWNERNVGLWNYNSREGECGGCFSRYKSTVAGLRPPGHNHPSVSVSPQTEETSFHFDGSGFSLVQKSLRATSTSIVLLFKTLSPGGLLLYLASNNTVQITHTHTQAQALQPPAIKLLQADLEPGVKVGGVFCSGISGLCCQ